MTTLNKLTDASIRKFSRDPLPELKARKADGGGLVLVRTKTGSMSWRMRYRFDGKPREAVFGLFPDVSLAAAREQRDAFRATLAAGRDPEAERKADKEGRAAKPATFRQFAEDLMAELAPSQKRDTIKKWNSQLRGHAIGQFGDRAISDIRPPEVRTWLVDTFQMTGRLHTMHETLTKIAAVFGRAAYLEAIPGNPLDPHAIRQMRLTPFKDKPHKAVTKNPARFAEVLAALDRHRGDPSTGRALQFLALTAQRPHMVRFMRWDQINWAEKTWEIDAVDMKGAAGVARDHMVPLTEQALAILASMKPISGGRLDANGQPTGLVFAGRRDGKPLSQSTMNTALRKLGVRDHVGHGFRASLNTFARERLGYQDKQDLIDLAIAHVVGSQTRRAYDRAELLDARRTLFETWANWLDQLRNPAPVVTLALAA